MNIGGPEILIFIVLFIIGLIFLVSPFIAIIYYRRSKKLQSLLDSYIQKEIL